MNQKVGIDLIHFATSDFFLGLDVYATQKNEDYDKFKIGIGQEKMSIAPPDEDVITLAAKAAQPIIAQINPAEISSIYFATESGVDQSKSAAAFVHGLLGLPNRCRAIEIKHACYAGAAALQMAVNAVKANPSEKVLVIASDIARYDLDTSGEATQGCGAVAMLIAANPRILEIEPGSGYFTEDVMDFWRPNYRETALVDGKYSTKVYLNSLKQAWTHFEENTGRTFADIDYFCYHIPFTKMAEKAHKQLVKHTKTKQDSAQTQAQTIASQIYNREIGNSYSASLFIGFCSLMDNQPDLADKRVSFFSYGSGCVAEFFSGKMVAGYENYLMTASHQQQINQRKPLTYQQYLDFYHNSECPKQDIEFEIYHQGPFRLTGIKDQKRNYARTSDNS